MQLSKKDIIKDLSYKHLEMSETSYDSAGDSADIFNNGADCYKIELAIQLLENALWDEYHYGDYDEDN